MFLPEGDRTFKLEQIDVQGSSSDHDMSTGNCFIYSVMFRSYLFIFSTCLGSRATRSSSRYNLSDLNDVISGATAMVKKEKVPLQIPKPPVPVPVNTSGSGVKKRKTLEILDLTVEDLEPAEVMKKLASMVETVCISLST